VGKKSEFTFALFKSFVEKKNYVFLYKSLPFEKERSSFDFFSKGSPLGDSSKAKLFEKPLVKISFAYLFENVVFLYKSEFRFALFKVSLFSQFSRKKKLALVKNCKWEKRESSAFPFQFFSKKKSGLS